MSEQQTLLKSSTEPASTTSELQSLHEPLSLSSQSLIQLQEALERTHSALEQQQKLRFHTFIRYQQQKQPYLALQTANECTQLRKLAQTIQKHQYRLECLHQRILSAITEDEYVKLRTCTSLIIQTLQEHLETASPSNQQYLASLMEILAAQQHVDIPLSSETSVLP